MIKLFTILFLFLILFDVGIAPNKLSRFFSKCLGRGNRTHSPPHSPPHTPPHTDIQENIPYKKRILLLADAFLTHYNFALNLANVLYKYVDYEVYFIVVKYEEKILKRPVEGVEFIEILFNDDEYITDNQFVKFPPNANWEGGNKQFNFKGFSKLIGFYMFSFYKAIIENPEVEIEGKKEPIFNWLKANKDNFDLGITEFCVMTGAVHVFEEIGLKNYVTTSSASPFPVYLYFLEEKFNDEIPERFTARVGDGLSKNRQERKEENKKKYKETIKDFLEFYQETHKFYLLKARERARRKNKNLQLEVNMPTLGELLRKSKYYFVNVHDLGQFPIKERSNKLVNIGGIEIEMERILKNNKDIPSTSQSTHVQQQFYASTSRGSSELISLKDIQFPENRNCLVLFSMGTAIKFKGFTVKHFNTFTAKFAETKNCNFLIRVGEEVINEEFKENLIYDETNGGYWDKVEIANGEYTIRGNMFFTDKMINQKEILENKKMRLFITHGGLNSFNEALYAGAPLLVIPFFGDQFSSATIAEYLEIGLSINHWEFLEKFVNTFEVLMSDDKYKENANKIKKAIDFANNSDKGQLNKFRNLIKKVIENKGNELVKVEDNLSKRPIEFEEEELKTLDELVEEFENKITLKI